MDNCKRSITLEGDCVVGCEREADHEGPCRLEYYKDGYNVRIEWELNDESPYSKAEEIKRSRVSDSRREVH